MSGSRRDFIQSGAALVAGVAGLASSSKAQQAAEPASAGIQVPKMKFGGVEISRLVLGVNQFYGFSHYNHNLDDVMREWYTPDRVCEVLRRASSYGINAYNYYHSDRSLADWSRFAAEGGKMHLIPQVGAHADAATLVKTLHPLALQRQGEVVDDAWQAGRMDTVKEWCKKVRDMGVLVGVGTHIPEVIAKIEEENWDVDFYAGCVYNRRRTAAEWKKALGGEIMEMPRDVYMASDPPRMYSVLRQTKKPCFAFKILAAGRIDPERIEQAFRTAFESIKPYDGVYVGMFPKFRDEVRMDAEIVQRILSRG
jgi:thiamine monophosphate synthase